MRRFVALFTAFALLLSGVAFPLDAHAQDVRAEAYRLIGYYPEDFGDYYQSVRFSITGASERNVVKGKSVKLKLSRSVSGVKWSSSNKKVATVSSSGKVVAKKAGKATITAKDPSTGFTATCVVKVYAKRTQAQARKAILSLKAKYYEGRRWTNSSYYAWEAAQMGCYGCAAFAGIASDKAFGKYAPFKKHSNWNKIKVGDSIRIGDWHSVIVLYKKKNAVVVCEGNYNSSIHWGATLTRSYLKQEGFEVWTRY